MLQPSSAASSSTVAASILKSPAIKKIIRKGRNLIAVHNLTNAYHTDQTLSNVAAFLLDLLA
jgi:hypothetical protein